MKTIKKWLFIPTVVAVLLGCCLPALADEDQMKITLVKIVNQLEAIKPLINQAEAEQNANPRYKIHFESWVDSNGETHNGLKDDIDQIQAALIDAINQQTVDPRTIQPLQGDFVGAH